MISIIVTIYNTDKYLSKCIDSILNQTYSNIELILVDDGSTDKSGFICDNYLKKDKRVKVIHKANGGVATARNAGLNCASGKYIQFVDSDDYISENFCEKMIKLMRQNNCDIVMCDFNVIYKSNKLKYNNKRVIHNSKLYLKEEVTELLFSDLFIISPVNKIYKASIFNHLRYPNGLNHEDTYLIYDILNNCKSLYYTSDKLYFRIVRNGSIMTTFDRNRLGEINAYEHWCKQFKKTNNNIFLNKSIKKVMNSIRKNYLILHDILTLTERKYLVEKYKDNFYKLNFNEKRFKDIFFCFFPNIYYSLKKLKEGKI